MKIDFTKLVKFFKEKKDLLLLFFSCMYVAIIPCLAYIILTKEFTMLLYYFSIGLGLFSAYFFLFPKVYNNSNIKNSKNSKNDSWKEIMFKEKRKD